MPGPDYSRSKRARCSEIRRGDLEEGEPARPPLSLARAAGTQLRPQRLRVHSPVTRAHSRMSGASGLCLGTSGGRSPPRPRHSAPTVGTSSCWRPWTQKVIRPRGRPTGLWGQTPPSLPEYSHHAPWLPTALSGPKILLPSTHPPGMERIMKKIKVISVTNI